ncbi:MAG: GNAT family N-acetyltransferase [Actinomycetota bacterium]|nr:GNAT family N-acetyltransferase [Actinomycetota bacterium]
MSVPPEPTVRRCDAADVGVVTALRRAWAEEQAGRPIDDDDFPDAFAAWYTREAGRRVTWLACVGHEPAGMLNLVVFEQMPKPGRPAARWGYVANAFVLAEHRNGGAGTALLDAAVDFARTHGFVRVVLNPSPRSAPLYRRAGFRPATELLMLPLD